MILLNQIKKEMFIHSKKKIPFFFKSYGYKDKAGILAYLSKRSSGIYKHGEGKNLNWNSGRGRLKRDLIDGKYFGLQNFLSVREYIRHFHNRRHYATVGGLPRGSKPTDNIESEYPDYCPVCKKELHKCDILHCVELNVDPPPNKPQDALKIAISV